MSTPAANADAGQATGTEQAQEAQQGPDFSPVLDRVEQLAADIAPMREWVEAQQQSGTEETQGESYNDFINRLFAGDEEAQQQAQEVTAPQLPPVLQDPALFQQLVDRAVQEQLRTSVAPELEASRQDRFQRQVADLVDRYPALQEQEKAGEIVLAAQQFAQEIGQPEVWRSPRVIEMLFLAEQARQSSDAEVPAGASGGGATLERGSGGNPDTQEPSLTEQLIQAHRGTPNGGENGVRFW